MRMFLAYNFNVEFLDEIDKTIEKLKGEIFNKFISKNNIYINDIKINFVEKSSMHITIKFFEDEDPEKIINLLKGNDFSLTDKKFTISGLDAFPNKNYPKVLIFPVIDNEKLIENNFNIIENLLEKGSISKEKNKFKPHLTIGRIKYINQNFLSKIDFWGYLPLNEKGREFNLGKLRLYQSILTPKKPIYKILYEF